VGLWDNTASAYRWFVDSNGNLGIGTSSPASKLHVANTAAATRITITDDVAAGRSGYIESNYSDALVIGTTSGVRGIRFSPDNTARMFLDTSGNLGIGTSSPAFALGSGLEVERAGIATLRLENSSGSNSLEIAADSTTNGIRFYGINNAPFVFAPNATERMRLTSGGDLQLGGTQGTIPALGRGMYVESTTGIVGYSLYVNNGVNNRRGSMFLDNTSGVWGWDVTASSGIPYYVWRVAGSEKMRLTDDGKLALAEGNAPTQALNIYRSGSTQTVMAAGNSPTGLNGTLFGVDTAGNGIIRQTQALPLIFSTNNTERARITSDGTLCVNATAGIGTSALTVQQTAGSTSAYFGTSAQGIYFSNDATTPRLVRLSASGSFGGGFIFTNGNTDVGTFTLSNEFIVGGTTDQGAYNLQCNGTGVWGAGAYVNGSDARLKDNIQSLDSGLDVVKAMRPVTFQYKPEYSKDQSVQPGFIAQELQEAMAGKAYLEGVVQEGTNHLNVAYQNIIPILVKAIQELTARVAALEGNN
jgi:hypothetical protein